MKQRSSTLQSVYIYKYNIYMFVHVRYIYIYRSAAGLRSTGGRIKQLSSNLSIRLYIYI